ncbi:MAG: thiamine phosphate synthase [Deltaproteobacteria bacterium]|nr:thiamine phosphate synthase [Deltaproteobacteria bacterium]
MDQRQGEGIGALRAQRADRFAATDLYPVTSAAFSEGRSTETMVQAFLDAGVGLFQLREKNLTKLGYYELARRVRAMVPADVLMFCNDHIDVALAVGADGVHLGRDDLPIEAARRIAPDLLIGASAHNLDEALEAEAAGADYVNIGPIFATQTKAHLTEGLGPAAIVEIGSKLSVPFTVMGGIKEHNLDQVLEAEARHIAVVTAVTAAKDPMTAARRLRDRIRSWPQSAG